MAQEQEAINYAWHRDKNIQKLVKALEATLLYLPSCPDGKGSDCGPGKNYRARCAYMKARKAIDAIPH